jgi:hypothetical protein
MQSGTLAPPRNRDVRQPGTRLAPVDAELLEPSLEVASEPGCPAVVVLEDEHADTSRLAIANRREPDLARICSGSAQRAHDRVQLAGRSMAEKGERDVQVLAGDGPDVRQRLVLPALDLGEHAVGDSQSEEEP